MNLLAAKAKKIPKKIVMFFILNKFNILKIVNQIIKICLLSTNLLFFLPADIRMDVDNIHQ